MMRIFWVVLLCYSHGILADKYEQMVCNSYSNDKDRAACIADMPKQKKLDHEKIMQNAERNSQQEKQRKMAKKRKQAEQCVKSISCLDKKYFTFVEYKCSKIVERLAKYDFKWTDGWGEFKFKSEPLRVGSGYVIRFRGDKLKMQNGFGAWSNVIYNCDIDVLTDQVVDVSARNGRL